MSDQTASRTTRKPMAPKAVAALVVAIASCPGGLGYGVPGIVLGAVGRHLSRRARAIFDADPAKYRGEKLIRAAEKWSRIGFVQGIILTVVWALFWTAYFVLVVYLAFNHAGG